MCAGHDDEERKSKGVKAMTCRRVSLVDGLLFLAVVGLGTFCLGAPLEDIGPHSCCHPDTGACWDIPATQYCPSPWIEQGNLNECLGIGACYSLADGACTEIDVRCCDDMGGTPDVPGSECPVEGCFGPSSNCRVESP